MKTLKSSFNIEGQGLMSGLSASLEIKPSETTGIKFHIDGALVKAEVESVASTEHCVVLASANNGKLAKIALVEHFMAACAICGIDGLDVHFNSQGFEMPILDGSAKEWVKRFNEVGYTGFQESVSPLLNPVFFEKDKSYVALLPSQEPTKIVYCVNFNHPKLHNAWSDSTELTDVIEARTFGYLKDLDALQKAGFSKGVTIENTVGLVDDGTFTTELRSELEPVKHKILDIIGDLYLSGVNPLKLKAKIIVKEAGHAIHVEAAKLLKATLKEQKG